MIVMHKDILDHFDYEGNDLPMWAEEGEVVAKFYAAMEAEVAAARLRSEGVPCFLANATTAESVFPSLNAVIRLHVHPNDSAIAREILQEAAIDGATPKPSSKGYTGIIIMAIIIGLLLAKMLVVALNM